MSSSEIFDLNLLVDYLSLLVMDIKGGDPRVEGYFSWSRQWVEVLHC